MAIRDRVNKILLGAFVEYGRWTPTTATYSSPDKAKMCCLLGMGGEVTEVSMAFDVSDQAELMKECGDLLYYIAHFAYVEGLLDRITIESNGSPEELWRDIGRLQELYKKALRDNDFDIRIGGKEDVAIRLLSGILSNLVMHLEDYDLDLLDVIETNKTKLLSRMERNVLHGEGGDR